VAGWSVVWTVIVAALLVASIVAVFRTLERALPLVEIVDRPNADPQ